MINLLFYTTENLILVLINNSTYLLLFLCSVSVWSTHLRRVH